MSNNLKNLTDDKLIEYYKLLKNGENESSRFHNKKVSGYDVKFGYHTMRLLVEAEQILSEGNLDLTKNNKELKAIRNGEWSFDRLKKEFEVRKLAVEEVFQKSTLPILPDRVKIRELLLQALEMHYGHINNDAINRVDLPIRTLQNIKKELQKVSKLL